MYGEILYYIENRDNSSRYYEMKKDKNKEIEKFLTEAAILFMRMIRRYRL